MQEVNGKQVQISLTGFMEKNTGKFMKELWALLLSAQKNSSGVPQQFLDAKEEETRKKKVIYFHILHVPLLYSYVCLSENSLGCVVKPVLDVLILCCLV